jgi:signal transduction histidine kinase
MSFPFTLHKGVVMKKTLLAIAALSIFSCSVFAAEARGTREDATALVARVVKAIASDRAGTLKDISAKDKKWIDRDLYPVVYDMSGKCLAHGQNEKSVGKDLIEFEDADGKLFVKERVELAKSKGKFWQEYKFKDPITKDVLSKSAYCEKTGEDIVCAGVYKR